MIHGTHMSHWVWHVGNGTRKQLQTDGPFPPSPFPSSPSPSSPLPSSLPSRPLPTRPLPPCPLPIPHTLSLSYLLYPSLSLPFPSPSSPSPYHSLPLLPHTPSTSPPFPSPTGFGCLQTVADISCKQVCRSCPSSGRANGSTRHLHRP